MKDRNGYWIFWFALLVIGTVLVYVFFQYSCSSPFRDLFLGNLFATILGVMIGIPVAIHLTRQQQKAEEKSTTQERISQFNRRKIQYLKMIQFSLMTNLSFLENIQDGLIPGAAIYANLDTEQLEATSSIKYEIIDDLKINGFIDLVRYKLRYIRRLLDLSLDFCYSQQRFNLSSDEFLKEHKRIIDRIHEELPKGKKSIIDTLEMIRDNLESAGVQFDEQEKVENSDLTENGQDRSA